jgi:PAS domain S-box-containing protein
MQKTESLLRTRMLRLLIGSVLACLGLFGRAMAAETPPRILVLTSYHAGLAWTDGQLNGLRERLRGAAKAPELFVEYLDTKRVPLTPTYAEAWRRMLAYKYAGQPFAAVVAQDDDALDFVLAERRPGGSLQGLPVIFSGVTGQRQADLEKLPAITGSFDDADIAANVTLLRKLRPGLSRVVFVHDHGRTGRAQAALVKTLAPQFPGLAFEFLSGMPARDIQARLAALDSGAGIILLTFNIDGDGVVYTHEQASKLWAEAATVPVLVKEDVMMVPGVLGGLLVSSRRQGELAARALLRVLDGVEARSLPMAGGVIDPVFRYDQVQRFGIDPGLLPDGSELRGRPLSLHETHPREFWLIVGLLAALLVVSVLGWALIQRARQERRLAADSERSYRELINSTNEAIFIHAPDGALLDVNDRFAAMYGYSRSELARLTVAQLSEGVPPYSPENSRQWLLRALNEGPQLFEWHARRANGSLFWVEVALRRAEISGQLRLIAAVRDISSRKEAEAALRSSEERYALILRNSPVGIVNFGTDWVITFCNERFAEILGTTIERVVGLDIQTLNDPSPLQACGEALAGRNGHYEGPYTATTSSQSIWVDLRTAPLFDEAGAVFGAIAIVENISGRVEAESALRALNEELEQRVATRTAELSGANEDLRRAMKQIAQSEKLASLGSLVAGVAHELNTPLGNARTVASTLHDHVREFRKEMTTGLRRSTLEGLLTASDDATMLLERNLERAAQLIGNFKQVAVDQTSMRRRRFDLRQVIDEVLTTLQPKLRKQPHRMQVEVAEGLLIDSYPGPLEQVLTNFVLNSLIHGLAGREDGAMMIAAHQEGDQVFIDYTDNGIGMDEKAAAKAFDPFYTTRLGQGGSGLGLYIVHNLVTGALAGSISLTTAPGKGVRFRMILPVLAPQAEVESFPVHTAQ